MRKPSWAGFGVLTGFLQLLAGCAVGSDPGAVDADEKRGDGAETVAHTEEAVTYVCSGTTQQLTQEYIPCSSLFYRGYYGSCASYNGCTFDYWNNSCYGPGGIWDTSYHSVKCSSFSTTDCPNHVGCSVAERCEQHCSNASTLVYCVDGAAKTLACQYGCVGATGSASCKGSADCDPSCVWQYQGSYGGGDLYVESYTAANSCANKTKSYFYKTGVCGAGVTPCQTLDRVECR